MPDLDEAAPDSGGTYDPEASASLPGAQPEQPGYSNWRRMGDLAKKSINPLISSAVVYGASRAAGANNATAAAAGALGGLMQVPGPHQAALQHALQTFTGNRQPGPTAPQQTPTAPRRMDVGRLNPLPAPPQPLAPAVPMSPTPQQMQAGAQLPGQALQPPPPQIASGMPPYVGQQQGMAGGGLFPGLPTPSKKLELAKPAPTKGIRGPGKLGEMGKAMSGPASDPGKMLRRFSQSPQRMLGRASGMRGMGLPGMAEGGPVPEAKDTIDNIPGEWYFDHYGTRTVPKSEQGPLADVADFSNKNVKANLPVQAKARDLTPEHMRAIQGPGVEPMANEKWKKDGKAHGGPIRGKMSEAFGGPKVPGADAENPLPGGKKAPMKFAKGGSIGSKKSSPVRGAGAAVRGVRPAKTY